MGLGAMVVRSVLAELNPYAKPPTRYNTLEMVALNISSKNSRFRTGIFFFRNTNMSQFNKRYRLLPETKGAAPQIKTELKSDPQHAILRNFVYQSTRGTFVRYIILDPQ